jgi:hypothetical protein
MTITTSSYSCGAAMLSRRAPENDTLPKSSSGSSWKSTYVRQSRHDDRQVAGLMEDDGVAPVGVHRGRHQMVFSAR